MCVIVSLSPASENIIKEADKNDCISAYIHTYGYRVLPRTFETTTSNKMYRRKDKEL